MRWMVMPLRRYADFSGRSQRKEYWMFTLLLLLICVTLGGFLAGDVPIGSEIGGGPSVNALFGGIMALSFLMLLVPSLAVQVRRLHDQDKTGWWLLINLVPYIGGIILLFVMCLPGTHGANSYGDDPREPFGDLVDTFG